MREFVAVKVMLGFRDEDDGAGVEVRGAIEFGAEVLTPYFNLQPRDVLGDFGHVLLLLLVDVETTLHEGQYSLILADFFQ